MAILKMGNKTLFTQDGNDEPVINTNINLNQILATADYPAGHIVQSKQTRYDTRTSFAMGTTVEGVELTPLRINITPIYSNSLIMCFFMVSGESSSTHNIIFNVYKDGSVAQSPYTGYNSDAGQQSYSGVAMALPYEGDYNSTPFTQTFMWFDEPGNTNAHTYAPGVKESNNNNYTWYLNRTVGSTGTGSYETNISMSIAWEVKQ